MGIFDRMGGTKPKQDGNYIQPGNYACRIDRVKLDKNRSGGEFVAVEMTVLHVIGTEEGRQSHKVGESISRLFCDYGPGKDYFLKELKAFLLAAYGAQPDDLDDDAEAVKVCTDTCDLKLQPLAGTIVEVSAKNRVGKTGKDFTNVVFKRRISPIAVLNDIIAEGGVLTKDEKAKFFKAGVLEALATEEAKNFVAPAKAA